MLASVLNFLTVTYSIGMGGMIIGFNIVFSKGIDIEFSCSV